MSEDPKNEIHVGLDLSRPEFTDSWFATAAFLLAEPYFEALAFHFPERNLVVDVQAPQEGVEYHCGHLPYLTRIDEHTSRAARIEKSGTKDDVLDMIAQDRMIAPYHRTPCWGKQLWFDPSFRTKSLVVLLDKDNCDDDEAIKAFGEMPFSNTIETINWNEENLHIFETLEKIRQADMVVTDNCAIALIASAMSVRHVTCLAMFGDESYYLKNAPNVRIFKRKPESLTQQYDQLLDFANREWQRYERYPAFLNQGDAKQFIQTKALEWCRGYGIDVGSNQWPFPGALRCDIEHRPFDKGPFDFVFSSHCLEHIKEWQTELTLWRDSLKPDGIMFIYVPHPLMEAWLPEGPWVKGGWHVWSPEPHSLAAFVKNTLKMELIEYTTRPDAAWGFHLIARKK